MTRFWVCTAITLLAVSLCAHAQERAADAASSETKMSWNNLADQMNLANVQAEAVNARMDKITNCGRTGKLYAPGALGVVVGDCFEVSSNGGQNLTTIVGEIATTTNNAITLNNNINNSNKTIKTITQCGQAGQVFNGTACVTPSVKGNCTLQIISSGSSGGNCSSCNNSVNSCPSGYVMTGANGGSTFSSRYCGRIVCN